MCDWPAWLAARPVARMNEAKSGNERNAAPDIASLIRATSSIASSLLAITARYDFAFSRRDAPELCVFLRLENQRAQGKPGARCTRSRACRVVSTRVSHHRFTGTPGLPCAMVLTVYFALSLVTGLSCHHRSQETCKQLASRELDASVGASGPHDFAVRAQRHSSFDSRRPSHPAPNVRDDRDTPLLWVRDSDRCKSDLGEKNTRIFLRKGLDTDLPSDARFKGGLFGRSRQSQKQDRV
jgi:hypothetical protein